MDTLAPRSFEQSLEGLDNWLGIGPPTGQDPTRERILSACQTEIRKRARQGRSFTIYCESSQDVGVLRLVARQLLDNFLSIPAMNTTTLAMARGLDLLSLPMTGCSLPEALTDENLQDGTPAPSIDTSDTARLPRHSRLAREIRDATGLSAAALGSALGVTREQYQRWIAGQKISDARFGMLTYLHTIVAEGVRVLGADEFRVWIRTPRLGYPAPQDLISGRRLDEVHQLVAQLASSVAWEEGDEIPLLWQEDQDPDDD